MKATFRDFCQTCDHRNTIDDDINGDQVCIDCGLCLDRIFKHQILPNSTGQAGEKVSFNKAGGKDYLFDDIVERIMNKCNIQDDIMKKQVNNQVKTSLKKHKKVCEESLVMACIYMKLIELETPKPMSHLCALTNISEKKVWHYIRNSSAFYRPHQMCECFLLSLNLSYKDMREISRKVKQMESKVVFSPKTLIAACAYSYLRNKNHFEKNMKNKVPKINSINHLSKIINVSPTALQKCLKKIVDL